MENGSAAATALPHCFAANSFVIGNGQSVRFATPVSQPVRPYRSKREHRGKWISGTALAGRLPVRSSRPLPSGPRFSSLNIFL
jgi:hypothetical protein